MRNNGEKNKPTKGSPIEGEYRTGTPSIRLSSLACHKRPVNRWRRLSACDITNTFACASCKADAILSNLFDPAAFAVLNPRFRTIASSRHAPTYIMLSGCSSDDFVIWVKASPIGFAISIVYLAS